MALLTNRDAEAWYDPQMRQWSQHHILYPDGGSEGGTDHASPRPYYLQDLPLPVPEILHFFGFNLELGTREVWEKHPSPSMDPEWRDYPYTIDLLGSYSCEDRTIRLYEPTIYRACAEHQWDEGGLSEVVRIHEYAHALHHQGAPASARSKLWRPSGETIDQQFDQERRALHNKPTDLDLFLALRRRWFESQFAFDKETLAQAATAIYVDYLDEVYGPRPGDKKSLKRIFWELMAFQPREYRLTGILPNNLSWRIGGGVIRECLRKDWAREIPNPMYYYLSTVFNRYLAHEVQGNRLTPETHAEFVMEMMAR